MDVMSAHEQEQERNLSEAREKMNDWIECIKKADVDYRNIIFKEAGDLLLVKAESDADLNDRINIAIRTINQINQIFPIQ